ncbi:MAG: hypothetical protein BAJALOKI1v1_1760003 [Promethearchaeota archaeon]|nr:MAG: hypothetical protein BAJALOKI1v1_1760003 [Candidatus Lokiarchaeota archaeon]
MVLNPSKILDEINAKKLDVENGIDQLITLIENSSDRKLRLDCLKILKLLNNTSQKIYYLLENLLISDADEQIRAYCARYLRQHLIKNAFSPIKWALNYEKDYFPQIEIIRTLARLETKEAKKLLLGELKKLLTQNFIDVHNRYSNQKFISSMEKMLKTHDLNQLSISKIGDILINHKTIAYLIKKFFFVYFKWENGLISELDLSDLGWNVSKSWEFISTKKISNLTEIPELMNLQYLKKLNLSNNNLENVKDLMNLKNLQSLIIRKNQLKDVKNIRYLKKMSHLKFLDLKGNLIASSIRKEEFSNVNLILKDYLINT